MDAPTAHDATLSALLEKFAQADCCWFSSVRPDGRAHLAPIWHVWHAGRVYVVTRDKSVRARNVAHNPHVSVALPDPMNVFIIEGTAAPAPDTEAALQPLFKAKYDWDISTDADYDLILAVTPVKLMAWGDHGEGRWQWSDGA
ncbi:MAG: pyridoxamine 5'-phosphate oxidase family protein [Caldilineaceae bacterium]